MSIEKSVLAKLLKLPADKQKEVLDFVETLEKKLDRRAPSELEGIVGDLGVEVSSEDIAEARREMWGGFPRG
jgi:mRNA-degrading endonuclease RelE of RelBE toxin-antitoxin system